MSRSRFASSIRIGLPEGSLVTLPDDLEVEVMCESGLLWITQLDNLNDIEAKPGERRLIHEAKAPIIIAVEAATLQLFFFSGQQTRVSLNFLLGRYELPCAPLKEAIAPKGKGTLQLFKSGPCIAAR